MRKPLLLLVACLAALGLVAPAVANAAPGNTPHPLPTGNAANHAQDRLLNACNGNGYTALYTPIPVGTAAPADDPATPAVNEANATAFVFTNRNQCRNTVNAGLPIGLLAAAPAGLITVTAPANFPTPAVPAGVTAPATATLANVVNGSATAPFTLNVVGANFTANTAVSALVTYRDNHSVVVAVGTTNGTGGITYPVAGACVRSQVPSTITLLQFPAGPAATATVPNTVCAGV